MTSLGSSRCAVLWTLGGRGLSRWSPTHRRPDGLRPVQSAPGAAISRVSATNRIADAIAQSTPQGGSDIHVMLTLRRSSRQVVVANKQLDGTDFFFRPFNTP